MLAGWLKQGDGFEVVKKSIVRNCTILSRPFRTLSQDQQDDSDVLSHGHRVAGGGGSGSGKSSNKESKPEKEVRTTTVLFVEFSKGGSMQKRLRECLDRINPMLGFKVRVTEKEGTPLGSLLSYKNLWSGV